jgi:Flp pilus assembly protein TadD
MNVMVINRTMVTSRLLFISAAVLLLCAASFVRNFCFEDEVSLWRSVVTVTPEKARPHNNYGHSLKEAFRLDEARAEFERALAIMPEYPDALNNLSTIYNSIGKKEEAVALMRRALALDPGHLQAKSNLALYYYENGMHNDSISEYASIIEIAPFSKEAVFANQMINLMNKNGYPR